MIMGLYSVLWVWLHVLFYALIIIFGIKHLIWYPFDFQKKKLTIANIVIH